MCLITACGGFLYAIYYFVTHLNIFLSEINKDEAKINVRLFVLVIHAVWDFLKLIIEHLNNFYNHIICLI